MLQPHVTGLNGPSLAAANVTLLISPIRRYIQLILQRTHTGPISPRSTFLTKLYQSSRLLPVTPPDRLPFALVPILLRPQIELHHQPTFETESNVSNTDLV